MSGLNLNKRIKNEFDTFFVGKEKIDIAKKKGFNKYEIRGDITVIFLEKRDGTVFETIIDTKNLEKVKSLDVHWHLRYAPNIDGYYAMASQYFNSRDENGRKIVKTIYLHKVITGAGENDYVDHIKSKETLNNCENNLRITKNRYNLRHRKDKNTNNTSGYRNVSWNQSINSWVVQLIVNGKNTVVGKFKDVHEAGQFAKKKRKELYGDFAGVG